MARVLCFAGSARRDSLNKKLAAVAAAHATRLGAEATVVDLADYPMPIYDGDLESDSGVPETAVALRDLMVEHDGMVIACPEYNGSITPLLKNVIDWTSRPSGGKPALAAYRGKVAALVATSPGALGGLRGMVHVRAILSGIGVFVVPGDLAVGQGMTVIGDGEQLTDPKKDEWLGDLMARLVTTIDALKGSDQKTG